jgi:hypothetical protein
MRILAHRLLRIALLMGVFAGVACTPALNWREVHLGHLSTVLPCKPDTATRPVPLAGQTVSMEMAGCEVAGALFAISRLQAADAAQAGDWMAALRAASLANVHMRSVHPQANSGDAQTSFDVLVDGKRPDGAALQARFKWQMLGAEVYQIAAYASSLQPEQTEPLLREVQLR